MATARNDWWDELADQWWDPDGPLRALHEVNPVRLDYFFNRLGALRGKRLLDLGCGAGLMTEAYARAGAVAVGIDLAQRPLRAGRRHARDVTGLDNQPRYVGARAETLPFPDATFDAVCTADALEHVADLSAVLDEAVRVLRPGGCFVFDTVNRTWQSRLVMLWLVQDVLRWAPRFTHTYEGFVPTNDLRRHLESRGLVWGDLRGLSPKRHPLVAGWRYARGKTFGGFALSDDTRLSYVGYAVKPD